MFRTLTLRAKILALPVVAALGFLITLASTIVLGRRAQHELTTIRQDLSPALEQSRQQLNLVELYQRIVRDAVAASDTAAISAADSIVRKFATINDSLARNATTDSAAVVQTHAAFKEYAAASKSSSMGMITGAMEDMMGARTVAKTKYAELTKQLNAELEDRNEQINASFNTAVGLQSTSFYSTSAILVVALAALIVLAWGTLTSVIGAMRSMSKTGRSIAQGNLDVEVKIQSKDEIGELAEAFRDMLSYIGGVAHAADRLASGDLSARPAPWGRDEVAQAMHSLGESLARLADLFAVVRQGVAASTARRTPCRVWSVKSMWSSTRPSTVTCRSVATRIASRVRMRSSSPAPMPRSMRSSSRSSKQRMC